MLLATWKVLIVRNSDQGLKMLPEVAGPRQHFSAVNQFYRSVYLRNFVIESTCAPATNDGFIKNVRSERVIQIPDKDVFKKRYFSIYFTMVAFILPFISLNLTMLVFCIGSSEGRTGSDDKGLVCYYSIKAYRVFLDSTHRL